MELRRYLAALKRRAWIPILLMLATTGTVGALAYIQKPQYVATATVQAHVTSGAGTPAPTQTLSLEEVVASHTLAIAVIDDLHLSESPSELSQGLQATPGHSDLYTISVRDRNPDRAVAIANDVAAQAVQIYQRENALANTTVFDQDVATQRRAFLQQFADAERTLLQFKAANPGVADSQDVDLQTRYQELLLDQQAAASAYQAFLSTSTTSMVGAISEATHFTANVLDPAVASPDLRSRYLKVAYAAGLALLAGLALIFVFELMDNAIREPESVEEMTGLPVVGIIPLATAQSLRPAR